MSGEEFITDIYELANVDGTPMKEVNNAVSQIRNHAWLAVLRGASIDERPAVANAGDL